MLWIYFLSLLIVQTVALPSDITQLMYCVGCQASVIEMNRKMQMPSFDGLEEQVMDITDTICNKDSFATYEYVPAKMISVCKYLLENHEEDIENIFMQEYKNGPGKNRKIQEDRIIDKVCTRLSSACADVTKDEVDDLQEKMGSLEFDEDLNDFKLKMGDNVRTTNPVSEIKDEL